MSFNKIYLLLLFFIFSSCSKFTQIQKSDNLDLKYKAAMNYYEKKDYYHAGTLFEEMIPILKGQSDAEKAQFYYSYSQYHQGQLVLSAYYFKKFYETFPRSEMAEEAYYMHCLSLFKDSPEYELDQTNTRLAIDAVQGFLERYPKTKYLEKCNAMVDDLVYKLELKAYHQAKLFHRMRDYRASVTTFENLIKDFPSSKFLEEASYLKVESQYEFAKISIEAKKKERLQAALEYYYTFIDKYPSSKYLKEAETVYEGIQRELKAS